MKQHMPLGVLLYRMHCCALALALRPPTHAVNLLNRLLMRASNARLPCCLALLQSNAISNGAGDAAKAVATATKAVEATVDAQLLNAKGQIKKKRARPC